MFEYLYLCHHEATEAARAPSSGSAEPVIAERLEPPREVDCHFADCPCLNPTLSQFRALPSLEHSRLKLRVSSVFLDITTRYSFSYQVINCGLDQTPR